MARINSFELDALDRGGCGVRAVFDWSGDRYSQTILAVSDGAASPLLEADAATPLQEIVRHTLPDSRATLLLTGAGNGHYWSATVTPIADIHFALLGFDFACRRGRDAALPAVSYRVAERITATQRDGDSALVLRTRNDREFLLRAAEMPTSISTESSPTCRLALTRQGVRIEALGALHVSTRKTVQWRYEVSAIRQR